ncbi:MAG: metallophosphoesterase family protein, partial [Bacteroidia bacterium]|nr:metallophosphoesterase family protein [Bacteroidia bacterium]
CFFADGTLRCSIPEHVHTVSDITAEINDDGDVTFETDGFSTYILYVSGNQTTVILACSDVQEPTNSYLFSNGDYAKQTQILTNIVSQVKTVYPTISGFFCGGDYNFDVTRGDSAKTQQGAEIVSGTMKDLIPGMTDEKMVLIQGNHDDLCSALTPTGGYDKGAYSVYVINEQSFPSGGTATQNLCQQTADGLRSWLNGLKQANYNKPVFILSHVPLHYSTRVISDGDAVYAQLLYDAIESYGNDLNIIFLYGHDHAHGDDDYLGGAAQFLTRGDKITIAQSGTRTGTLEKTLNFTYMNYGFVGYFWDTWGQQSGTINYNTDYTLTMTTFEINGGDVTIRRWDENGQHVLKAAGAASQGDRGIADPLTPNTKTYASPQTVESPKGSGEEQTETYTYTDDETKVTVKTNGNYRVTIEPLETVSALEEAGITEYLMFDVTVEGFSGKAEVTMPTRPGYNTVWHVKDGKLEQISDAVFNGDGTVTFTTTSFSPMGTAPNMDDSNWFHVEYYDGLPYNVCNPIDFPSGKTGYVISHIDVFAEFEVPVAVNGKVFNFNPNLVPADTQYVTLSGQYGDGTLAGY